MINRWPLRLAVVPTEQVPRYATNALDQLMANAVEYSFERDRQLTRFLGDGHMM